MHSNILNTGVSGTFEAKIWKQWLRVQSFLGLSPTDITDPQCIVDINPVTPLESARRKVARAQKQAENPERDNKMSKKRLADQADDETVFIPHD